MEVNKNKWIKSSSEPNLSWEYTIPAPESPQIAINHLPGDDRMLGIISRDIPMEKGLLKIVAESKPPVLSNKNQLIRIIELRGERRKEVYIRQIKQANIDFN